MQHYCFTGSSLISLYTVLYIVYQTNVFAYCAICSSYHPSLLRMSDTCLRMYANVFLCDGERGGKLSALPCLLHFILWTRSPCWQCHHCVPALVSLCSPSPAPPHHCVSLAGLVCSPRTRRVVGASVHSSRPARARCSSAC